MVLFTNVHYDDEFIYAIADYDALGTRRKAQIDINGEYASVEGFTEQECANPLFASEECHTIVKGLHYMAVFLEMDGSLQETIPMSWG